MIPPLWVALFDGVELTRHRAPFYEAARALLDRGASPEARLRMRHRGSETVSMTGLIGELAKFTVTEGGEDGLTVVRWQARSRLPIAAE